MRRALAAAAAVLALAACGSNAAPTVKPAPTTANVGVTAVANLTLQAARLANIDVCTTPRDAFVAGAEEHGTDEALANAIWDRVLQLGSC